MARRRTLYLPVMVAAAVLVACLVVSLALSERAQTSFPGKNGRIAYFDRSESGDYEMYSMKPDGTGERLIARHGYASVFSPDGKRIAYPQRRALQDEKRRLRQSQRSRWSGGVEPVGSRLGTDA